MKPLVAVSDGDVPALTAALRAALEGGPAVFPHPEGRAPASTAGTVDDGIALVVETSGSTNRPKRVALSAEALRASGAASASALGGPGQWLLALPAHYIAGAQVLIRSILAGTDPVALGTESFTPERFADAASRLDATGLRFTSLVPVQLARLVEAAALDPGIARAVAAFNGILVGGQALAPSVLGAAVAHGWRVVRTYGSSETAGGCVYDGVPLEGVRARIARGEIELGGPNLADGYLGDAERTAAAFRVDAGTRWYRTGDLGTIADGVLTVTGRADDVIISGGVKVVLGEVEQAVRTVPGFADAVVVPVADAEWGERPGVAVAVPAAPSAPAVPNAPPAAPPAAPSAGAPAAPDAPPAAPGADADTASRLDELVAATDRAGLGPAARPVRLLTLPELPRLASGKPDRRALAALFTD
ncbi:AMP-binding protein [Agromyces archimandritae]|uniref:AMP-binding protein n=1 Tax=Agromyces archimandritae TaxID=2781962 RepID=A0A975FKN9_9MICO|nr:AMP-binding protein [Agromyces archimandritae]QTX03626.1 AMP-binding protein [Agromyces archimandritae]